jgi:rhodanese-related sulfurtransferase
MISLLNPFRYIIIQEVYSKGRKMRTSKILAILAVIGLLTTGSYANTNGSTLSKPSQKVQSLITKYKLNSVDFNYVKKVIAKGTRNTAKAILIDARPEAKYKKSTIPSSINIPDTKFDEYIVLLKDTPKDKELIVYCGGYKCAKSPKVAGMLIKKGFTNVKVYPAGEPEWIKKSYKEVDAIVLKSAYENNSALIVDARPYKKFLQETIPGSISIPDTKLDKLIGRFPFNKDEKIIVFCGGFKCAKSHIVAKKLVSLDYKNVSVYAAGLPAWKKLNLPTTVKGKKVQVKSEVKKKMFSNNGLKLGADEGSVDGEWFKKLVLENKVPSYVQIVDVTAADEFKAGHIRGAVNIEAANFKADEFYKKLPKNKTIVFNCTAGGRSIEAWTKLNEAKIDVSEIFYFDANIDCIGNKCKIEANEPLD